MFNFGFKGLGNKLSGSTTLAQNDLIIIMLGQSGALSRSPKVTTTYPSELKTFDLASEHGDYGAAKINIKFPTEPAAMTALAPFSEFTRSRESWAPGLANGIGGTKNKMFFSSAIGSRHYRELKKGNYIFDTAIKAVRQFNILNGSDTDALFVIDHGESESDYSPPGGGSGDTPVSYATYLAILNDWIQDVKTHLAYYGEPSAENHTFLISSTNRCYDDATDTLIAQSYRDIKNAQLEAGLTINNAYMIGAKYQFDFETDHIHSGGLDKKYYAEKAGSIYSLIKSGVNWKPVHMTSATETNSTTITVDFYVPEGGDLVIDTATHDDTSTIYAGSKYGVEIYEGGVQNAILNITVSGTTMTITVGSALGAGDKEVRVAQLQYPNILGKNMDWKNRSNIRSDSNIFTSPHDGTLLYDWAVPQYIGVA